MDLTPHSTILYNTNNSADQEKVWPLNNTLNFKLETLTDLKLERNKLKRQGQGNISYQKVYSKMIRIIRVIKSVSSVTLA